MSTHHIIIGGGPAATNALETIRQVETGESRITLICDEPPYSRMALPYWIAGTIPREHTLTGDDGYFRRRRVDARLGVRVTQVDPRTNSLVLSDGNSLAFDNLLIATGSSPLDLRIPGDDLPAVQPVWTLGHSEALLDATRDSERARVVFVGGGFIGFIVLAAMFKRGWRLTVVERETHVLPRMLDRTASGFVEHWLAKQAVDVHTQSNVREIREADNGARIVELDNGQQIEADLVIVATGIRPNLELAAESGIKVDEGILVNDRMQTNFPKIFAGGDVAQGPVLFDGKAAIHAIQPTAVDHGRVAGANMAGREIHYPGSLLMNVVDVCGLQCASFGRWDDPEAETTTISFPGGFIYRKLLWRDDQLVGALFTGRANDLGMLTDVGMIKGFLQTRTHLGQWKTQLTENPHDIRRAYVATGVAEKLAGTMLLGRPTEDRKYHYGKPKPDVSLGPAHAQFVATK